MEYRKDGFGRRLTLAPGAARRAASEAQRRLLAAVVESTHDAVFTTDRDGQEIWVSLNAAPLREADGVITGMAVIAREVTDQQQLLTQLAESEARQRLLLANLPGTLVALYDRELRCQMLDGAMVRGTGLDPSDYIGRPISQTLAPEQYEALER